MVENNKANARKVAFETLNFTPRFAYGDQAAIAEITGSNDHTMLGAGLARFTNAAIPWTVRYDEVLLVLEGRVIVRTTDGDLEAGPKDCIWLPKGTDLTYIADNALVFYAIHPANWAEEAT